MEHPDITLYDKYDYDYSKYWEARSYEHDAEINVINRILRNKTGNWCIDIGGSYGRHIPQYSRKFHHCVILDYSVKALKQAREIIKEKKITNVDLIAANAYNLPLKSHAIDTSLMIRVLHHLEKPELAIGEVSRVSKPGGLFILEFANKLHLKSILKNLFTFNFSYLFSVESVNVKKGINEGSLRNERGLMLNFHPRYIKNLIISQETRPRRMYSLSFFRIPFVKQIVPYSLLSRVEHLFQLIFGWTKLTPSIMIESYRNEIAEYEPENITTLEDLIVCPKCKGSLRKKGGSYSCTECDLIFSRDDGILDLRYPRISE